MDVFPIMRIKNLFLLCYAVCPGKSQVHCGSDSDNVDTTLKLYIQ